MEGGGIRVSIVVAMDLKGVIGNSQKPDGLPWPRQRKDMKRFVEITKPKPIIIGRKTYEFIEPQYRPLKDRPTIVVSRAVQSGPGWEYAKSFASEGAIMADSPNTALVLAVSFAEERGLDEVIIAGGEQIYDYFLKKNLVDRIYLTQIWGDFEGDAKFPIDPANSNWSLVGEPVRVEHDEQNKFCMVFSTLDFKPR